MPIPRRTRDAAPSPAARSRLLDRQELRAGGVVRTRNAELERYVDRQWDRLHIGMQLLEDVIDDLRRHPPLELGGEPWLFTQLLLDAGIAPVTGGNRDGVWTEDTSAPSPERVVLRFGGAEHAFDHHLFNAERDRWPFEDGSFTCVICMELLEHLSFSPAHLLYEANRVLRPGGRLVLTTPNAASAAKLGAALRGRSLHHPYSGWGVYGRHNREFDPREVELILREANFEPRVWTENLTAYRPSDPLGRALHAVAATWLGRRRRDNIFAVARKSGPPRYALPESLYRSFDRERLGAEGVLIPPA